MSITDTAYGWKEVWQRTLSELVFYEWQRYVIQIMSGERYGWGLPDKDFLKRLPKLQKEIRKLSAEQQLAAMRKNWYNYHREHVCLALADSEKVPANVLAEYSPKELEEGKIIL